MFAWVVRELVRLLKMPGELAHFRRTFFRSLIPILASAVIVVGIFCSIALRHAETTSVKRVTGNAGIGIIGEVERSNFRQLRERFQQLHEKMMMEKESGD